MKTCFWLSAAALMMNAPASALTFAWSFPAEHYDNFPAGPIQSVTGTISGLVEGSNRFRNVAGQNGKNVAVTVTSSPFPELLGGGYEFVVLIETDDPWFVVTNGNVTYAGAYFRRFPANRPANSDLPDFVTLGGFGGSFAQGSGFANSIGSNFPPYRAVYTYQKAVFTAVPEPAVWTMLIVGFCVTGAAMRRVRAIVL